MTRPPRIGIGGPVGSGKTMLCLKLCQRLRARYSMAVVTNDIYCSEDAQFLIRHSALPAERIAGVEIEGVQFDLDSRLRSAKDVGHDMPPGMIGCLLR